MLLCQERFREISQLAAISVTLRVVRLHRDRGRECIINVCVDSNVLIYGDKAR